MISVANTSTAEKLAIKVKEEFGQKVQINNTFKEKAFQQSLAVYTTADAKKKYMADTLKLMTANAELKPGTTEVKTPSQVFATTYKTKHTAVESEYFAAQRKAGTLPWSMATDEEIKKKAASVSKTDLQKKYEDNLAAFSKKYHPVTPQKVFA